jgi:small-conductance mechanosensitive channel
MEKKLAMDSTDPVDVDSEIGTTSQALYINPEKEKAAFKKFDKYVLPVSIIFMVLSSLDRNNVSRILAPSFHGLTFHS